MTQTAPAESTEADGEQTRFASLDPRTGEVVGHHPVHTAADVEAAVLRARTAAAEWAAAAFCCALRPEVRSAVFIIASVPRY